MRARSVQRVRAVGLNIVRGVVVVLAGIGLWMLFRVSFGQVASALPNRTFGPSGQTSGPPGWIYFVLQSPLFSRGASFCLLALVLASFSRWITRFVFRPPVDACPRCGHELTADDAVCSECGQRGLD